MTNTDWIWTNKNGAPMTVTPVGWPDDFEWFAEGPGQRPPQFYELRSVRTGHTETTVVFPYEPWSPYDAIVDKLRARGWVEVLSEEERAERERTCEHGMSARFCAGPDHYDLSDPLNH